MQIAIDMLVDSVCGEIGRSLREYTIQHAELVGKPVYILPDGTLVSDTAWNHWMWTRTEPDMGFRWGCYVLWTHWLIWAAPGDSDGFWDRVRHALQHGHDGVRYAPGVSRLQLDKELR